MKNITSLVLFLCLCCTAVGQTLIPFQDLSGKWGYKNGNGEIVIVPQYKRVNKFQGKYAVVIQNDSTEVIDSSRGLYFPVVGVIDTANNIVVPIKYHHLQYMGNEQFVFGYRAKYLGEFLKGVITTSGKQILPPIYSAIALWKNYYFVAVEKDTILGAMNGMDLRGKTTLNGLYNEEGREVIPCQFMNIRWANDSLLIVEKQMKQVENYIVSAQALYTKAGKPLTPFKYMVIDNFKDGLSKVRYEDKFGFINPAGVEVIPLKYKMVYPFEKGYAMVQENEKWGVINLKGEAVVPVTLTYQEANNQIKDLRQKSST